MSDKTNHISSPTGEGRVGLHPRKIIIQLTDEHELSETLGIAFSADGEQALDLNEFDDHTLLLRCQRLLGCAYMLLERKLKDGVEIPRLSEDGTSA